MQLFHLVVKPLSRYLCPFLDSLIIESKWHPQHQAPVRSCAEGMSCANPGEALCQAVVDMHKNSDFLSCSEGNFSVAPCSSWVVPLLQFNWFHCWFSCWCCRWLIVDGSSGAGGGSGAIIGITVSGKLPTFLVPLVALVPAWVLVSVLPLLLFWQWLEPLIHPRPRDHCSQPLACCLGGPHSHPHPPWDLVVSNESSLAVSKN